MSELSPLWESEDAPLQLDEALELIDACDLASTLSDIDCGSPRSLALSTNDVTVVSNRRKRGKSDACAAKKRVRNPADDVRRRERRKAERLQLQEQVQEHEARVERLKKASRMAVGSKSDKFDELGAKRERSKWLDAVVEQVEKRRKAEELNAELKTLLVQRLQMTGAISDLLTKEPAHLAAMVKRCTSVLPKPILQGFTGYPGIATELQGTLHRIFDSTDLVLGSATLSSLESISSSSRIKQRDPINGPSIELSTTTPLACELAEANAILWSAIMEKQWPGEQATFKLKMKRCTPRSVELRFTMGFDDPQYDWVRLNGVTLLEKHDEDHRSVLVWTTLVVHPSGRLRFRSQGWIVAMRSPVKPALATVVRTCCRLSVEHVDTGFAILGGDRQGSRPHRQTGELRSFLLRAMSQRMKTKVEGVQQQLLERTGAPEAAALLTL